MSGFLRYFKNRRKFAKKKCLAQSSQWMVIILVRNILWGSMCPNYCIHGMCKENQRGKGTPHKALQWYLSFLFSGILQTQGLCISFPSAWNVLALTAEDYVVSTLCPPGLHSKPPSSWGSHRLPLYLYLHMSPDKPSNSYSLLCFPL